MRYPAGAMSVDLRQRGVSSPDELVRVARARELAGVGRLVRERAGLTLGEVAHVVGCSPSTIIRWERGEMRPAGARAVRYADLIEGLLGDG
jgi:transcriptional regulator with XRE-family HTH domain